ncbi:MAG: rod shape-determining protein [Chloroflexi bacterium]|nr:rod shape-determining protein [Chloroflexota bacterium]
MKWGNGGGGRSGGDRTSEVAVLSSRGIVYMRSVRVGGDQIITVGAPDNQRPYRDEDGRKHHRSRAPRT